jgi:uncharacterized delta-60 repeat protein
LKPTSILRLPLLLALAALAIAAFGTGSARAACEEETNELAFQASGKLLVALCGPHRQAAVLRLDGAGKLDPSFAGDGSLGPWPSNSSPHVATAADGKLLVQMSLGLKGRHHRIVLRRFSVNGTLDNSFAAGNAVVPTNPSHSALAGLIRVFSQPGGTSVVAYYAEDDGCFGGDCSERTNFIRLFRYSATGKPIAKASYYTEYWDLYGLAMAPDGGLIATGDESEYGRETYLRTKPNLKSRFGKVFDEESGPGSVVAAGPGATFLATSGVAQVSRYGLHGAIDATYGVGGSARCESATSYFSALQDLGSAGLLAAAGAGPCGLVEFLPDGSLNPAFGSGGSVDLEALGLIPSRYQLESVAVGPAGEIAVSFRNEDKPIVRIARFSADGQLETGFGKGGVVTVRNFQPA